MFVLKHGPLGGCGSLPPHQKFSSSDFVFEDALESKFMVLKDVRSTT